QVYAIECCQCADRKLRRIVRPLRGSIEIDLRHFVAIRSTGVLNRKAHIGASVCSSRSLQLRIGKFGVRKSIAEREERLDVLLIEPAIAYKDSFRKSRFATETLRAALRMRRIVRNVLIEPFGPRKRQPPRR